MNNVAKLSDYRKTDVSEGIDLSKCTTKRGNVHFLQSSTRPEKTPVQQHAALPYHVVVSGIFCVCTFVAVGATLLGVN